MNAALGGALPLLLGGLAGLVAGSFIGALVLRWPRGESIARGRSRCDACGHGLGAADLVPLVSFAVLRGRCRWCGAAIPPVHFAAEAGAALIGVTALAAAPLPDAIAGLVFGWTLLALALLDLEHFWLPDLLTLPLAAAGIAVAALGIGAPLADRLVGAAAGYLSLRLIALGYRAFRGRTGLGGGDPKLFAAIGAWLAWQPLAFVLLLASLLGLVAIASRHARGDSVTRGDAVPLGALLAVSAWPLWLIGVGGVPF